MIVYYVHVHVDLTIKPLPPPSLPLSLLLPSIPLPPSPSLPLPLSPPSILQVRCCQYWPELHDAKDYGKFQVLTQLEQVDRVYITRRFKLRNNQVSTCSDTSLISINSWGPRKYVRINSIRAIFSKENLTRPVHT